MGTINISGNTVTFIVQRFEDILQVIIPIFDTYSLLTTKVLDFMDFRTAVMHKQQCGVLTYDVIAMILSLKNGMNSLLRGGKEKL